MAHSLAFWFLFNVFVLAMLGMDLLLHRRNPGLSFRKALAWTGFWFALAVAFAGLVYVWQGGTSALQFATGYVIEESLSIDNLFVFLVLFRYFQVPSQYQHKVLLWGVAGALALRLVFILVGVSLLRRFEFFIYIFGAILIYSGIGLFRHSEPQIDAEGNAVVRLLKRFLPVTQHFEGARFFIERHGKRCATPMFIALVVVETTDVLFAVDSIPAVLAITRDAFIVYTSNVFAILGLRSLYFVLERFITMFRFLNYGLALVLCLVGASMLASHYYQPPIALTLGVVLGIVAASIAVSVLVPEKQPAA
jgi:tellurite resistance protein TerC